MAEPNVPVPVSLLEALDVALREGALNPDINRRARAITALLSQPNPTVEPCGWCNAAALGTAEWQGGGRHPSCGAHGHNYTGVSAAPPSIADMVPGTTFRAVVGGATGTNFLMVIDDEDNDMFVDSWGQSWSADDIDPSTIRNVTPPEVSA